MKRMICILLAVTLLLAFPVSAAGACFEIYTVEDLLEFAARIENEPNLNARLMSDLDLGDMYWDPMGGHNFNGVDARYAGDFDGNGYTIYHMTIRKISSYREIGFFEVLGEGSCVHDLTLENVDIDVDSQRYANTIGLGSSYVGAIVGRSDGVIENCHVSGVITGLEVFRAGGIAGEVGYADGTRISGCTADVEQIYEMPEADAGYAEVGGIAGTSAGTVDNCHSSGNISLTGILNNCGHIVGGVVGFLASTDAVIRNCSNSGDIYGEATVRDGEDPSEPHYGGILADGIGEIPITNCFNTGNIEARADAVEVTVGGIEGSYHYGYRYSGSYDNCWSSGQIKVTDVNGERTDSTFRTDPDLRAYFVGEGSNIGSHSGQILPKSKLTDGSLTVLLNENVYAIGDGELIGWVQTADGPRLGTVRLGQIPFEDVRLGTFYLESVIWAAEQGITTGTTPTTFSPETNCERCAVVTFLWRAAGCPEPTKTDNPFSDVNQNDYFYKAVLWAVEKGITNGMGDGTFGAHQPCTRAHVVTFLYRALGSPDVHSATPGFTDVDVDEWYSVPVIWAVEAGVTNGMGDGTFGGGRTCTRGQIVTFLYRAYAN